jgi:hypothetical protein
MPFKFEPDVLIENRVVEMSKQSSCELKIKIQNDINVYLHQAFPLCIILADERMRAWYYERYIQIYSEHQLYKTKSGLIAAPEIGYRLGTKDPASLYGDGDWMERFHMDFMEPWLGNDVLQEIRVRDVDGADPDSILDFVEQKINIGHYLYVFLDEYYLPNKSAYQQNRHLHPSLIYGYDHDKRKILAAGFEHADFISFFTSLTFDYDDFEGAYRKARQYVDSTPEYDTPMVTLLKPKELIGSYPFTIGNLLSGLNNYLTSNGDTSKLYLMRSRVLRLDAPVWDRELIKDEVKFGMAVYDDLIEGLEGLLQGKSLVYHNHIHLFFEHKKAVLERLNFACSKIVSTAVLPGLIEEYAGVAKRFHNVKFQMLQIRARSDSKSVKEGMIKDLISLISAARKEEYETLSRLHDYLAAAAPDDGASQ